MENSDQTQMVYTPYITLKNGQRLYAKQFGKKAFCFPCRDAKDRTRK